MSSKRTDPTYAFIGGTGRSGTSVTKHRLLRHPHVNGKTGELRWINAVPSGRIEIPDEWLNVSMGAAALGDLTRAPVLIDDSPESIVFHRELLRWWPEARFIHMVRHPTDTVDAIMDWAENGNWWCGTPEDNARRVQWVIDRVPHPPPACVLEVRLEDLLEAPPTHLARICDHIGIDYRPELVDDLDPSRAPRPLSNLDGPTIERVERITARARRRYGYPSRI